MGSVILKQDIIKCYRPEWAYSILIIEKRKAGTVCHDIMADIVWNRWIYVVFVQNANLGITLKQQ